MGFGSEKRFEDFLLCGIGNARPLIGHGHHQPAITYAELHLNRTFFRAYLAGILNQI